jgi:carbon-monoxide dehydrogenase medium subunit
VKPRYFEYHRPTSIDEVLELLSEYGDEAKILAGGQSLIPMLNFRIASPAHLIDINSVTELDQLNLTPRGVQIGATSRQRTVENAPEIALSYPLVRRALVQVAHPQIRNRGTFCGSVAHADASAELPSVVLALDAQIIARSSRGERTISAEEFFEFHLVTALASDELLFEVKLPPLAAGSNGTYVEIARRAGDFALAGVAVQAVIDESGTVESLRMACSGVGPVPQLLEEAAQLAIGSDLSDELLLEIDSIVRTTIDPPDDVHASANYRRVVTGTVVRRALKQLRDEARTSHD